MQRVLSVVCTAAGKISYFIQRFYVGSAANAMLVGAVKSLGGSASKTGGI